MKFKYIALTPQNERLTGALEANNQAAAEAELHRLHLAIVSIEEISDQAYLEWQKTQESDKVKRGIKTFRFVATDQNQQTVDGTIDALGGQQAFERLINDYHFEVKALHPVDANDAQKQQFATQLKAWQLALKPQEYNQEEKLRNLEEQEQKINAQMVAQVDRLINEAKKTLLDHPELFSSDLKQVIDEKLGELERVRTSNNLKHITEIGNDLYDALRHPDQIEGHAQLATSHQRAVERIEDNELIKKESLIYQKALSVEGMKQLFGNIVTRMKSFRMAIQPKGPDDDRPLVTRVKNVLFPSKKSVQPSPVPPPSATPVTSGSSITGLHLLVREANGFVAWLVFFYIGYFLLANLVVEKQLTLIFPDFFLKTLQSPLIFNVSLFFIWIYFTLLLIDRSFKARLLPSILFFGSSVSLYAFVVVNF